MNRAPTIVWFRRDLRLGDHPALTAAVARGGPVIPVFVWAPDDDRPWTLGPAARWWLNASLEALASSLRSMGSRLIIREGPVAETLMCLAQETGANAVLWQRIYEPAALWQGDRVSQILRDLGIGVEIFDSSLLYDVEAVTKQDGTPYQVFTAFWKKCLTLDMPKRPVNAPKALSPPERWPESRKIQVFSGSEPVVPSRWAPGESGGQTALDLFLDQRLAGYASKRDRPDAAGTSQLSAHLSFGEVTARQVWWAVMGQDEGRDAESGPSRPGKFLEELGWRDFAKHLLYRFPHTLSEPLRPEFKKFPWRSDPSDFEAWKWGQTGYPMVDAGMRQLLAEGWIHNRQRMLVASFLIKDLLLPWQEGARWFWERLVDADLANNTLGWQWVAGSGADAAPYFRVFNPTTQGEKFDPHGTYVRRWVHELAGLPDRWVHRPWSAPDAVLERAGVRLGADYPRPIVNHAEARRMALAAFEVMKHRDPLSRL